MPALSITASDPHVYDVTLTHDSGAATRHRVMVPESLMSELGLSTAQEPLLVRASLSYLMERSPAAVPERFDLDEIGKAVPEYAEEILDRL
jgi:hypothetical protein